MAMPACCNFCTNALDNGISESALPIATKMFKSSCNALPSIWLNSTLLVTLPKLLPLICNSSRFVLLMIFTVSPSTCVVKFAWLFF